jgi:hypothetical protein
MATNPNGLKRRRKGKTLVILEKIQSILQKALLILQILQAIIHLLVPFLIHITLTSSCRGG